MGRPADRRIDIAVERRLGDRARPLPDRRPSAPRRSEPSQVKLNWQPVDAPRAFEDHAADGVRIGRMADPVEHDLGDRALAVERLGRRLVIDGGGQAIERAGPVGRADRRRLNGRRRRIGARWRPAWTR